jgi:hypothetical protein
MVKNEAILLEHVLPIWSTYPVDLYIFYDDSSLDHTRDTITKHLGHRARIITGTTETWNEAANRWAMLEESRHADYVLSLDADELTSANFWSSIELISTPGTDYRCRCFNLAGDWTRVRRDPKYLNNYLRIWARPNEVDFDLTKANYHTQRRLPSKNLPVKNIDTMGNIHLQSLNTAYYALKQLWYKHWEYHMYKRSIEEINRSYDKTVNNLNFVPGKLDKVIRGDLYIDPKVFDGLAVAKGYKQYVLDNLVEELVTFGHKYLYA